MKAEDRIKFEYLKSKVTHTRQVLEFCDSKLKEICPHEKVEKFPGKVLNYGCGFKDRIPSRLKCVDCGYIVSDESNSLYRKMLKEAKSLDIHR